MLKLHNLTSLVKKRKRVGRGGSRGGTSGKGHKGQKARSGPKIDPGFEGGQMPLYRRLPKRGFNNELFRMPIYTINIGRLNDVCADGDTITKEFLVEKNIIKKPKSVRVFGLKVLGKGDLVKKINVESDFISESARQAIEQVGGSVTLIRKIV